jgi:hypothetical protein
VNFGGLHTPAVRVLLAGASEEPDEDDEEEW